MNVFYDLGCGLTWKKQIRCGILEVLEILKKKEIIKESNISQIFEASFLKCF